MLDMKICNIFSTILFSCKFTLTANLAPEIYLPMLLNAKARSGSRKNCVTDEHS